KYDYDGANRLIKLTYPLLNSESWSYDVHGNLASHTDANGKVATFNYDALNRLTEELHGAPFNKTIRLDYDGASNLKFVDDGTVKIQFPEYDTLNRLKRVDWLVNNQPFKSIRYEYDAASNREQLTGPEGEVFKYVYDENNRLKQLQRASSAGAPFTTFAAIGYDAGGPRTSMTLAHGPLTQDPHHAPERPT